MTITPKSVDVPVSSPTAAAIKGYLYGNNSRAVIFSNMDTNSIDDWNPVVSELLRHGYMLLTYSYSRSEEACIDDLKDVLSFIRIQGAEKIILIGASRGGVISISIASDPEVNEGIIAIAAMSAPIVYEDTTFYSNEELIAIKIPKLLINSENDDWADDTHKMYEIFREPKALQIYEGDAHGTEIFLNHQDALTKRLVDFVTTGFSKGG